MTTRCRAAGGLLRAARSFLLLALLLLLACGVCEKLTLGQVREREIRGGEKHHYGIALPTGNYLRVAAEQKGVDVYLSLTDPRGETVLRMIDSPTGDKDSERLHWVAESGGTYRLTVHTWDPTQQSGHYRLQIEALGSADEKDRARTAAERELAAAEDLRRGGHFAEAIQAYEAVRPGFLALEDRTRVAYIDYQCGKVTEERLEDRATAHDYYQRALRSAPESGDQKGRINILLRLGPLLLARGDEEEGLERLAEARRLSEDLADPELFSATLNTLAIHHRHNGEPDLALRYYSEALDRLRVSGDQAQEAQTLSNLGLLYVGWGKPEEAIHGLARALAIQRKLRDLAGQTSTLTTLGHLQTQLGEWNQALATYHHALRLHREIDDRHGEGISLSCIGWVKGELGDHAEALELLTEARAIFHQVKDPVEEARALRISAALHLEMGRPSRARELYELARSTSDDPLGAIEALAGLARSERQRGDLVAARAWIEAALDTIETVRTQPSRDDLRTGFFASKQRHYDFYIDLLMAQHEAAPAAGHAAAALAASERARARSLLEGLMASGAEIRRGVDTDLLEREEDLAWRIQEQEHRLHDHRRAGDAAATAEAQATLDRLARELSELQGEIRVQSPRYAALTQPEPLATRTIQERLLDDETLLLEYRLGETRSFLWIATPAAIITHELPARREIEAIVANLRQFLAAGQRNNRALQHELRTLSETILAPACAQLGTKRLLIVPEGALQHIPFAALPDPCMPQHSEDDPAPLLARHEIVSAPSASTIDVLRRQRREHRSATKNLAVLADPVFESGDRRVGQGEPPPQPRFSRLRFTRQEAQGIAALLPASAVHLALDFNADRALVTSGALTSYKYLHFATHGEVNETHPMLSSLVLSLVDEAGKARNGFLYAHEIYNLELAADLVVLSACETGLGKQIRGEGIIGLTRAFMYAGAPSVVVSLWRIEDEVTAELMTRFYRHLLEDGMSPAAALRAAQLSVWQQGRDADDSRQRWAWPYLWAAFTLQGLWE